MQVVGLLPFREVVEANGKITQGLRLDGFMNLNVCLFKNISGNLEFIESNLLWF